MEEYLIDCAPGISGDMLLGALYDLGIPQDSIEKTLISLGLKEFYKLSFNEAKSSSIRGIKAQIEVVDNSICRDWRGIRDLIIKGNLEVDLEKKIISVFQSLAEAESKVHGIDCNDVHFHEIGSIDSLVDIIGVCTGFYYLKPKIIYCNIPTLGKGFAKTEHGIISIPSPAVIELVTKNNLKICSNSTQIDGELSTPTGIALLLNLIDSFEYPHEYQINSYGVGIGSRKLSYPNLTRVMRINSEDKKTTKKKNNLNSPKFAEICIQEAWIDDQSSEEISSFVQILRKEGALDVSHNTINMKKGRIGHAVKAILPIEKEDYFRNLWFTLTNTIGIREERQGRWTLLRRKGYCITDFGKLQFKQVMLPDGRIKLKPENDEIFLLQKKLKKSADEIKLIINKSMEDFIPTEEWE